MEYERGNVKRVLLIRGFIVYMFDITSCKWKRCADVSRDRSHFASVWHRSGIYAVSTYSVMAAGTVEKYDIRLNRWSSVANLPRKLRSVGATVLNDKLYVIGGHDTFTEELSDMVFVLNDENGQDSWSLLDARLLRPRSKHSSITFLDKIWVAGGSFPNSITATTSVEIVDPNIGVWQEGPCMLARREYCHLLVVLDNLFVVGGDVDEYGNQTIRTIERFDLQSGTWVFVTSLKEDRRGFSACAIGSKIYVFAGTVLANKDDFLDSNTWDAYDVEINTWESDISVDQSHFKMPAIDSWGQAVAL